MSEAKRYNPEEIRRRIENVFANPPLNEGDLHHRLTEIDEIDLRACLIDMLKTGAIKEIDGDLFVSMMMLVGIGEQKENLFRIAVDRSQPLLTRSFAVSLFSNLDPAYMEKAAMTLPSDEVSAMSELSLLQLFRYHHESDFGKTVRSALEKYPPDELAQLHLFELMERARLEMQAPALSAYGEALKSRKLSKLHARMLEIVSMESDTETIAFLKKVKKSARGPGFKREVGKALLRARSNSISSDKKDSGEIPGYAYVSSCDGQGAFIVLGCFENKNRTHTVVDLVIRLTADIRDGFLLPYLSAEEVMELVGEVTSGGGLKLVKVPLSYAADLAASAEKRTVELGKMIPEDTRAGLEMFKKVSGALPATEIDSNAKPALSDARQLIHRPEYMLSWFFDRGDLKAAGVEAPTGRLTKKWKTDTAAKLGASAIKGRLWAMIDYMSRWHAWNNEADTAALCKALAKGLEKNVKTSPLVHAMLEHSTPVLEELDDDGIHHGAIGDDDLRREIKVRCFVDVNTPKGKDLARLDFTEAAHIALGEAFQSLPGELRPRESQWIDLAFAAAGVFLRYSGSGGSGTAEQYTRQMRKALTAALDLSEEETELFISTVHQAMCSFSDQVCIPCDLQCRVHPRKNMADAFFADEHPAVESAYSMFGEEDDFFGEEHEERAGRCVSCDAYGPVDGMSMCDECGNKFERDMLRLREWNVSVLAFGLDDKGREALRQEVIAKFGKSMELIASRADESSRPPNRSQSKKKRRRSSGRKKKC